MALAELVLTHLDRRNDVAAALKEGVSKRVTDHSAVSALVCAYLSIKCCFAIADILSIGRTIIILISKISTNLDDML